MNYSNFGSRGRGFGPQGTRAARRFSRPRFPRPPFRHAAPPRPVHPGSFGMPWQPSNMFFQPNPLRGSPQFRSDGRRRRFSGYNIRFPAPNPRLPIPPDYEEAAELASSSLQIEFNQDETVRQLPLSEEERQQKITETADRLKQNLSSFSSDDMLDIWNEDVPIPSDPVKDDCLENRRISLVRYESTELNLTYNDVKDIGRINSDNVKLDDTQHTIDIFNIANNTDSNIILDENENGSHLAISSEQMTNLENVSNDNEYAEINNWEFHESIDNSHNLEQSDLHGNDNIENELIESDVHQYDTPSANISVDQDQQEQDTLQEIEVYPTDATKEQDESETLNLQTFPINSVEKDILQEEDQETPTQNEDKFINLEVQESVLNSHVHAESSNNSNNIQPALADMPVNNVVLDNQSKVKENSLHNGPPKLSPHTEQELPVDFDPSTPPPILLKQDQPRIIPPYSIPPDLPPLFDPTAPPPSMKCLLGPNISHEDANPAWSNAQNPMPINVYKNIEIHTGLNATHGFMFQQLSLEMPCQNNVFLPPHVDPVNFSPTYSMASNHSGINTHVPSMLPQMHATPHNIYVSPSSLPELSPSSDLSSSVNKDDGLDDMQEAMKFAKEMTSITRMDEESKSSSKSLSESSISINPIGNVEFIALPPGKPKIKSNKLKKMKEDDACNKKKIVSEEQSTADCLLSEETIQDVNVKSNDASLMKEQDRPKVIFNLNNKTKVVNPNTWQENNDKKNGMTQSVELEKTSAVSSLTKKNFENILRHRKKEGNLKSNENNSGNTILAESIANQDVTMPHKKSQKDIRTKRSQCPGVSLYSKVKMQKSRSQIEKRENFNMVTSWKNKIISRFLKMSKNDIYNMVNNTSLKKFDIIMKRLVKEKRPTLSLEMRHAQDEKMKLYDQQEFMKQLNAMLDTNSVVSVTDLPTEFIHHLNEVLQLDVQPDNHTELAATSSSQCDPSENVNYALHPATHITECANETTTSNSISRERVRNKSHTIKIPYKDVQAHKINDLNFKDDTCNTIVADEPSISSNLLTLQHDLDDIFSEVTKKNQNPAAIKERKRCSIMGQQTAKKFDTDAISRSVEKETILENDRLDDYPRWDEKCDRWKRKEWEDPHAYRNLTKEEWEARYGTQANSPPSLSTKTIVVNNETLASTEHGRKVCLRRRYSSESSRQPPNMRHRSLEKDKHKKSRRHSDDRRHSTSYLEHHNHDSNSSSRSSSTSSSSTSSSSSNSNSSNSSSTDTSDNTNVTKLLRVIKENEKVAKKMTLNETIRDEVNAEIERERKSRKLQKNHKSFKSRKQRKAHYKRKKRQSKETTSSCNSSSEKDNNNETTGKLLTEDEIKKEIVENQTTQEVIVKEEIDIGQENIEDAEFASASNLVVENKVTYLPASQSRLESPSAQEIPATATQLHAEDRMPAASPTQPKTKAQLKQMPDETSDMNDNKVPLNAFTCIPEDWTDTLNNFSANISEYMEDFNRSSQTTGIGCDHDKAVPSTFDSFVKQDSNTVGVSCGEADESAIPQLATTTCTESSAKIQDGNEISSTDNNDTPMIAASTSSVSNIPPATAVTRKQGASKKIDIKTYYERTIQRRMNEKLESKRPVEKRAISPRQNSLATKTTESEIAASKSTLVSTYSGSIQDPRLVSARVALVPCATNSKDNVAQATPGKKPVRQKEKRATKEPMIAELAPRRPEEKNSNRTIDSDSAVKKINQGKSKDKISPAAKNIKVLSNVVIAAPKSTKGCPKIKENITDKKSQSQVSDPKRFKNIRSEGGKELKLKEMAKEQKAKKKSASKSVSPVSAKTLLAKTTKTEVKTETAQEKKIDNTGNINKIEIERVQLAGSRKIKINNSNMKAESPAISSGDAGNDRNKLPRDADEAKERSSSLDTLERESAEKPLSNVTNTHKRAFKAARNKEARSVKRAKNVADVGVADEKGQGAKEISDVVPEPDVSTASKIGPEVSKDKAASENEKVDKEDLPQRTDAKDTELSSSHVDQGQIKKSNSQDPSESIVDRDVSSISELDKVSRLDGIDVQSKEDHIVLNSDIKTNDIENNIGSDVLDNKSASANEDESLAKKTAELSPASNENSRQQGTTTSDSAGSPFKGFLEETMMDFEQPSLFDFKLDEVDASKKNKIFLDDCNANCGTSLVENPKIDGIDQDYEMGPGTHYDNDPHINANENFDITFNHPLLASDKECATYEKDDKSGLAAGESGEERVKESTGEIIATTLHDEDGINISSGGGGGGEDGGETEERPLMSKEGYTCAALAMKESMFINEEEIQSETRKDLASKLKTTTDPSLSDALETTISDDALRLPESQGTEHLDNHMYLETNISAEKLPICDKLPGFDSDEHLASDMFYLDDRLGAAAFDNKDDESVHFSVHQSSPRYNMPAVIPEVTMIAPCADPAKPGECKFDLRHVSCNDLAGTSAECSPRTLNVPTKAALKEPATNLFLKSPSDVPTKETVGILDKTRQSEADLNYHTRDWHVSGQNNVRTHPLETHNNTITQSFHANVNTPRKGTCSVPARKDGDGKVAPSNDIERHLHGIQRTPVVELRKIDLDRLLEKKRLEDSRKMENGAYENQKKHNGTILHKLRDKRPTKRQSKTTSNRLSLAKRLKKMCRSGRIAGTTKEAILARMLEIDLEMHKLTTEKLRLHELLRSNILSTESSAATSDITRTREDDTVAGQFEVPQLAQNSEISDAKYALSRPVKGRKRISSRNPEDKIVSYTPAYQKTKMPVIRWKKKPRLEQTVRREEDEEEKKEEEEQEKEKEEEEEEEEEDLDEMTERQTTIFANKKVEDGPIDAEDVAQKADSNVVDDEAREEKTPEKSDKEPACDTDSRLVVCLDKSTVDKSADDHSECRELAEGETERVKDLDIDKRDENLSPDEAPRANSQPPSSQVRRTSESLSIYSDDSTEDSPVRNIASELHENRKATGLALLNESLKKEQARSRKMKALMRKKQKQQLDNYLKTVNNLTMQEEKLPLSKLYIRKLQQKRDLLDSLSQRKEALNLTVDPSVSKNMDEVINAVAENRIKELYEPQLETRASSDDAPATSDTSPVLQPDKHQFYVDAEANANSDWPCREKENVEEAAMQQESNDVPSGTEGSNHVFKAVSQDKVPFYDERTVEPDSSITPEGTLASHSSDCERDRLKVINIASCNFDLKVSVPKVLIKNDFSLGLLQKLKDTEGAAQGTSLIDSTTNVFSANTERSGEKDKDSENISQVVKSTVEENKKDEKDETKDKHAVDANEREEIVDNATNAPSAPQSSAAKSGYSDAIENEESGDSVASNRYDKIAIRDAERDSDSTVEKTDMKQKKSDAESDQLSNDAIALKEDCLSTENAAAKIEEKSNPENKSSAFERILDHDQSTSSSVPADLASEKSEESNEMSIEQKSGLEHTLTSTFSFNKAAAKGGETSKKLNRKQGSSTPVRRSTRNVNENVKSGRIKEADANSNSSERESSVFHERNFITRSRSKSPMRAERITNNGRKNRVAQKKLQNRKAGAKFKSKSKAKVEDPIKYFDMIAESVISKNKITRKRKPHTEWQMKNCKVRLIDCKSALLNYLNPEVLEKLEIANPCVSNDTSCDDMQCTTSNQSIVIPIAASDKDFSFPDKSCDKTQSEVEILEEKSIKESSDKNLAQESVSPETDEEAKMQYMVHKGPILDIKVFENSFLAASEDSKIYRYSQMSNGILNIYKGHKSAVTCLYIYKSDVGVNKELMYSGSLDGTLRCYNIMTGESVTNPVQINSAIQCMDQAWGIIFIGTKSGHVSRFYIKAGATKGTSISFSDKSVLALKATNEGPRRILIVASRNQPVIIRDAQTGLFLRKVIDQKNHTVYSLLRHDNLIYCGTSSTSINVFDFTTGEKTIQYVAGVGIVCLRLYKQLLFAGCYNGYIYVFDINNHKLICSIRGPGNMLLSIEVVNNKIIAGSKDKRLHLWQMPTEVRALL